MRVQSLGQEDPLEEGRATHSSIPAWRIPRTEEPGGLQTTGSQSQTRLSDLARGPHVLFAIPREKTCLEEPLFGDKGYKPGLCKRETCQQTCLRLD